MTQNMVKRSQLTITFSDKNNYKLNLPRCVLYETKILVVNGNREVEHDLAGWCSSEKLLVRRIVPNGTTQSV